MISILLALKLLLLLTALFMFGIVYFHGRETVHMENRLGLILPRPVKHLLRFQIAYFFLLILLFTGFLFV